MKIILYTSSAWNKVKSVSVQTQLISTYCSYSEEPNKMQQCIKIYYSIFIWSSTCFGQHTAHHQEPKTAQAATGFAYVEGCQTCSCWTLSGSIWGGVSPETCWASFKI